MEKATTPGRQEGRAIASRQVSRQRARIRVQVRVASESPPAWPAALRAAASGYTMKWIVYPLAVVATIALTTGIVAAQSFTEYASDKYNLYGITVGPDGNLWFTAAGVGGGTSWLGKVTT